MFCPKCGLQNSDSAGFCLRCGYQFPKDASAPGTAPPPAGAQPKNSPPQPVITPEMVSSRWYYTVAQQVYGPIEAPQILRMLKDHALTFDTLVKLVPLSPHQPDYEWVPLGQTFLYDLFISGFWQQNKENDIFTDGLHKVNKVINDITGDSGKLNISFSQLFSSVFIKHSRAESDQLFIAGTSLTTPPESEISSGWPKPWLFSRIFATITASFLILCACCVAFGVDNAANVVPGLIFLGSLAVPFTLVVFFWEINVPRNISFFDVLKIFFIGGTLSLFLTFLLNQFFPMGDLDYFGAILVGIVEESAKLLAVLVFVREAKTKYILNGLLIGAATGAGFAVFETAGYALWQGISHGFDGILSILFLRGALSVGGHVVWTAIAGAAIIMAKKNEPLTSKHVFSPKFLKLFCLPVILHAIWDMPIKFGSNIHFVNILLTVIVWFFVIKIINSGLKQIEAITTATSGNT